MADDLFNRFRKAPPAQPVAPTTTPGASTPTGKPESGLAYRSVLGGPQRVSEAEALAAIEKIPSMPLVVQKLLVKTGNTAGATSDLEALISQDMALAGRLLKLVNSPFYNLPQPVSSIAQAVAVVGLSSLKSLAVAASTSALLDTDLSVYGFQAKGLWTNSIATAGLARAVALRNGAGKDAAEEYFVAGLLRDVGMLVLGPFLADRKVTLRKLTEVKSASDLDILRRERDILGIDHAWAGERVGQRWTLPDDLRLVITHHHRIPQTANPTVLKTLASVRLAERLIYSAGIGVLKDHPFETSIDAVLLHAAGLSTGKLEELVKELPAIVKASEQGL